VYSGQESSELGV